MIDSGTSVYDLADSFAMDTDRSLFITGKAGTGKTTFLKRLRERSLKVMAVVAPTGVAAINAGGMTIHSFFQLPIRTLLPTPQSYRQLFAEQRMTQRKRNMLYHLEMLIIDEISMVRADVLDAVDAVLRRYKHRPNQPFGGVQVVMIGDLFQLSPVVTRGDEQQAMSKYYDGPYFFNAKVMEQLHPVYIELDHVFRQQDADFVSLLNEVRENRLTDAGRAMLNARYKPDFKNTDDDFHITLTTHNSIADNINGHELSQLPGRERSFRAEVVKDFPQNNFPADETLTLKQGARVMFIRNDDQNPRRFYNGKMGIVDDITDETIIVRCDDGDVEVGRMEWSNIRYREDEQTGTITEEKLGSFIQYPLRLAWAVTIHKSQGLTFDKVIIDAARAFASGQVYVALSRCRTLQGIVLSSPLHNALLANDTSVVEYTRRQPPIEASADMLPGARREHELKVFTALFDMRGPLTITGQMRVRVKKAASFNGSTLTFIDDTEQRLNALLPVSEKFQAQLTRIIMMPDEQSSPQYLTRRLKAAAGYFMPLLSDIADSTAKHPCRSKNMADAADFETLIRDFFVTMHQKTHLMSVIIRHDAFTADSLLAARNSFAAPVKELQAVMEKPARKKNRSSALLDSQDMALDDMIRDFLDKGLPSSRLQNYVNKLRKNKASKPAQRAGERWTQQDDMRLKEMFMNGAKMKQLMQEFSRTRGSITARLKKLGLTE